MYTWFLLLLGGGLFYAVDGVTIVKNTVMDRYRRFKKLNNLVATKYKHRCMIILISLQMVCQAMWYSFLQWMNNSVRKLENGVYEITYVIQGRRYKMLVKPVGGPSPIFLAVNENDDDVTNQLLPYIGVQNDFHKSDITPRCLGYKELTLEMFNGESKFFKEKDSLNLL